MSDELATILDENEIEEPVKPPVGAWYGEVVGAKIIEGSEDQNFNAIYKLYLRPQEPGEDVDPGEADQWKKNGDDDPVVYTKFINGKKDGFRVQRMLQRLGHDGTIRESTKKKALSGIEAKFVISHEWDDYFDDEVAVVTRVMPPSE